MYIIIKSADNVLFLCLQLKFFFILLAKFSAEYISLNILFLKEKFQFHRKTKWKVQSSSCPHMQSIPYSQHPVPIHF